MPVRATGTAGELLEGGATTDGGRTAAEFDHVDPGVVELVVEDSGVVVGEFLTVG